MMSTLAVVLCSLLSCCLLVAGPALAADGHHAGQGDHGHLPEIGHNPPAGTTQKDFESPAWFQTDLAVWSFVVFLGLLG
ncbi:MAG: hypothetical protein ACKOWG_00310, partial [Planctomycetia bacterium]